MVLSERTVANCRSILLALKKFAKSLPTFSVALLP